MVRVGKISSVNKVTGTVRVTFEDKNNIVSNDMPCLSFEYNMPSVGDMVICIFLDTGIENGICLGRFYNNTNRPINSDNGFYKNIMNEASYSYDPETKTFTINAQNITLNGNVLIQGDFTIDGDLVVNGTINGGA